MTDLTQQRQAPAVIDHDVRVLAPQDGRVTALRRDEALEGAVAQAQARANRSGARAGVSLPRTRSGAQRDLVCAARRRAACRAATAILARSASVARRTLSRLRARSACRNGFLLATSR